MRVGSHTKQSGSTADIREPKTHKQVLSLSASAGNDATNVATSVPRGGFKRVPTYAVRRAQERRRYTRVRLALCLRIRRIAGQRETNARALRTKDISSSGVYFLSPRRIEPGTPIALEVLVVDRPLGHSSVRMCTEAHVVRADRSSKPGWYGVAATFDDISFLRDEPLPSRFVEK